MNLLLKKEVKKGKLMFPSLEKRGQGKFCNNSLKKEGLSHEWQN